MKAYVGTYRKYNQGSLKGDYLYVQDYDTQDEFLAACAELHSDERDPEFMIQDIEGIPEMFYHETGLKSELWEYLKFDERDQIAIQIFASQYGNTKKDIQLAIENCQDVYWTHERDIYNVVDELVPHCAEMETTSPYMSFDRDQFIRDNFVAVDFKDGTYYAQLP